jgi:ribosomal silencing factor RsfS
VPGIYHHFFGPGAGHYQAFPARPRGIVKLRKKKVQMPGVARGGWAIVELTDALVHNFNKNSSQETRSMHAIPRLRERRLPWL